MEESTEIAVVCNPNQMSHFADCQIGHKQLLCGVHADVQEVLDGRYTGNGFELPTEIIGAGVNCIGDVVQSEGQVVIGVDKFLSSAYPAGELLRVGLAGWIDRRNFL